MIVLDASAALAAVLGGQEGWLVQERLLESSETHVPEHFHAETLSGLRRLALRGDLDELAARRARHSIASLRALRHPVLPLYSGMWARRDNLSAYGAAYLALAEQVDARLLTVDGGLAAAARAEGRLVSLEGP